MWMFGPTEETTEPQGGGCSRGVPLRRVSPGFANVFGALKICGASFTAPVGQHVKHPCSGTHHLQHCLLGSLTQGQ